MENSKELAKFIFDSSKPVKDRAKKLLETAESLCLGNYPEIFENPLSLEILEYFLEHNKANCFDIETFIQLFTQEEYAYINICVINPNAQVSGPMFYDIFYANDILGKLNPDITEEIGWQLQMIWDQYLHYIGCTEKHPDFNETLVNPELQKEIDKIRDTRFHQINDPIITSLYANQYSCSLEDASRIVQKYLNVVYFCEMQEGLYEI
jgi:hypothetical protein